MKRLCIIFMFIFMFSFSMAQPPFLQTEIISEGIQVGAPVIEFHKANNDFIFHAHAHNATNGLLLTNATTICHIHILRPSDGDHIIDNVMSFHENLVDFELNVSGGNFTEIGQYVTFFYCEVAGEIGGFFEYGFDVTAEGGSLQLPDSLVRMFLIIFFITLLASTYFIVRKIDFKKWNDSIMEKYKEKNIVKMVLSAILYNIMKNIYMIYYLIGLPIMIILANITRVYNISGLIIFMDSLLLIYTIGILIVGLVFLSYVQEWIAETIELVKNLDWGIE